MTTDDLLERADAALTRPASSDDLGAILSDLQDAVTANDCAHSKARERERDGALSIDEKREARAEMNRLSNERDFLSDRLKRISAALSAAIDDEAEERKREPYEAILAEHAALVEKARAIYPSAVAAIVDLLGEIARLNAKVATMQVPRGLSKPEPVECVARGIGAHELNNGYRSLLSARLPPWQANSPSWPSTAAATGISPAVAGILDQVAEADARVREKWRAMEIADELN